MGLDTAALVMDIEDRFGILFDENDSEKIETCGGILTAVVRILKDAGTFNTSLLHEDGLWNEEEVWLQLQSMIARFADRPTAEIHKDTRLVEDLGF